jgi:soluble lytic murein transglycosylase
LEDAEETVNPLGRTIFCALIAGSFLCLFTPAHADIYRFRDERGVWHFSNVKSDPRYKIYIRTYDGSKPVTQYIRDYDDIIHKASKRYGVDVSLIKAVIKAESDFNQHAVSNKGAQGLMQLMPGTAEAMDVEDPFDARDNIHGGTRYLSLMLERFNKDMRLALAAYNAGPERVAEYRGVPPYQETKTFIDRVLGYYKQFNSSPK